jgi:hypothetical protein
MEIKLTHSESENYFYNALCNGLHELTSYGLDINHDSDQYKLSKSRLKEQNLNESVCYEDVLMQMLRDGYTLTISDFDSETEYPITLTEVHERVQLTHVNHLMDMVNEQDDAITADVILQTVFFKEVIFG